jgi:SAM-dependent methyltransferase
VDSLIAGFSASPDGDLMVCEDHGVAYQRDMSAARVAYGADYLAKVDAYEDTDIARAVNAGRCALLARHIKKGATLLDIGAGSGAFMRAAQAAGFAAKGFDVIPEAAARLRAAGDYASTDHRFAAVCMWDVIEHLEDPEEYLDRIAPGVWLFVSLPIFPDLHAIRASKHYRPGEHLYYFRLQGFIEWMAAHGFRFHEFSTHEMDAGRESIAAIAFRKNARAGR